MFEDNADIHVEKMMRKKLNEMKTRQTYDNVLG